MIVGTAVIIAVGSRLAEPARDPVAAPKRPIEKPWLSREATAQIIAPGGGLGPLFAGAELGGPAPGPEIRERIAAFARANDVRIDLDIIDDELAAVRFEVAFAGCCGYEGADGIAMKLGRPHTGVCCVCGPDTWFNDWSIVTEDGSYARTSVRVNRVVVRWEPRASVADVIERADALFGARTATARAAAGDRWIEGDDHRVLYEVGYVLSSSSGWGAVPALTNRRDLGLLLRTERGRIAEVAFDLQIAEPDTSADVRKALRRRWGHPHIKDTTWTWHTANRSITAEVSDYGAQIVIAPAS
jgi:hypothetical protein